jgi:hypothetical protein
MSLQNIPVSATLSLAERMRASRTSINPRTYLSTDFLNQFNEVTMTLDMLVHWPDMFQELRHWQFHCYEDHFRRSGFADAETLIDAYWAAPIMIRRHFDDEVDTLVNLTNVGLCALKHAWDCGPVTSIFEAAAALSADIRLHVNKLASTINIGHAAEIVVAQEAVTGMEQADIDALFA